MIGDTGKTCAIVVLTRPRGARPFTVDDVQRFDPLRPWLAHALRRSPVGEAGPESQGLASTAGTPVMSGEMILTPDRKIVFRTNGLDFLLNTVVEGKAGNYTSHVPVHDRTPAPIAKLLQCLAGAANEAPCAPPRMQISTPYGVVTLEAKWLVPFGVVPGDVAKDPKGCLMSATIELREHAIAYAARMLRKSGATPTQVKVGIQLAMGKTKQAIADELGIKPSSVADQTKRLYRTLEIHNSAELGTFIWLTEARSESRRQTAAPELGHRRLTRPYAVTGPLTHACAHAQSSVE